MLLELPRPTVFAHRGASAHAPENTLAAFELAARQNAPAIELDAMLCGDGHIVVIHDDTVDRTTDGHGRVRELSLGALQELRAGAAFGEKYSGERIPTLSEVFETVGNKLAINIELKNYASPFDSLPEKTADLITHHHLEDSVLISSFNPIALRRFKQVLPSVPVGMLATRGFGGSWARNFPRRWLAFEAIHPDFRDASPEFIRSKQKQGLSINVYTVNHPQDISRLCNWGVEGIITDDPLMALSALETESREKVQP